ncbi:MAG: DUF5675 family protein [Elusimicrobiota bacterium]|jgi:hypothetical protein|nr:DUF5675 family protein [Elusimicrobiota bacterium]
MRIEIKRFYKPNLTFGDLFIDDEFFCYTLELPYINNERDISCIKEDYYVVKKHNSPKFGECLKIFQSFEMYDVYELGEVAGRSEILIHSGNYARDTKGCILVGDIIYTQNEVIGNSKKTLKKLLEILDEQNYLYITKKGE